jgi:pyruvate carboxylase subunit B
VKYVVEVNGELVEVEVDGDRVVVGGAAVRATLTELPGTPLAVVRIERESHRVVVHSAQSPGRYALSVDGFTYRAEALDERTRAIRELSAASTGPSGPAPLLAPMPGLIVRVNVSPGDEVAPGQGLVVMEAMKMENELRASAAGVVRAVLVAPGIAVEKGATLVELA